MAVGKMGGDERASRRRSSSSSKKTPAIWLFAAAIAVSVACGAFNTFRIHKRLLLAYLRDDHRDDEFTLSLAERERDGGLRLPPPEEEEEEEEGAAAHGTRRDLLDTTNADNDGVEPPLPHGDVRRKREELKDMRRGLNPNPRNAAAAEAGEEGASNDETADDESLLDSSRTKKGRQRKQHERRQQQQRQQQQRRSFDNNEANPTAVDDEALVDAVDSNLRGGRIPPSSHRLPNVLLIGAQKGGSSAIAHWLFNTGGICRPTPFPGENVSSHRKEAHYFDKNDRYEQGIPFYAKRFQQCTADGAMYAMDATPAYLAYPERVRETYDAAGNGQLSKLKIVLILREPVARDLSVYNHKANLYRQQSAKNSFWKNAVDPRTGELLSFEEYALKAGRHMTMGRRKLRKNRNDPATTGEEKEGEGGPPEEPCAGGAVSFCYGLYATFLRRWMALFRHDQILVLSYDELVKDEASVLWRLREFLPGLNVENGGGGQGQGQGEAADAETIKQVNNKHHPHKVSHPPCELQRTMAETYYEDANRDLYDLLATKEGPAMEQRPFPRFVLGNCTRGSDYVDVE